ncbi:MAG: (d)CMP kinase [bacterium]|nr:MAG: (d)CMP kinase [bacterium]
MGENKIDVIAIDGPAGSGKSTTARLVAQKLGFTYLDTGAMYRAITLKALNRKVDVQNESEILSLIRNTNIELQVRNKQLRTVLDGEDVTHKIRTGKVSRHVSTIAAFLGVRDWMVQLQRKIGNRGKIVAEGRDIGTAVFPNARLKIFLIATLEERAKRRQKDFVTEGETIDLKKITEELNNRDHIDSTRAIAPLRKANDAIELDTTNLTIKQQVDFVVEQWNKKVSS